MGYAVTILSKEEAMALPPSQRPLNYRITSDVYHRIFEDIGQASMCWEPRPSHEVFKADEAANIAADLCHFIADALDAARGTPLQ